MESVFVWLCGGVSLTFVVMVVLAVLADRRAEKTQEESREIERRRRRYECVKCGYSMIGNVSGRCPECGTPIERA